MMNAEAPIPTQFERLGGQPTVDRLVDTFYRRMDSLPEARTIRALHAEDLDEIRRVLKLYLAQWLGGPPHYSAERGHPRLRARHLPFAIGAAERDAWLLCMEGALTEVVTDARLRAEIGTALAKLADWMRNQPGEG